MPKNNLGKIKQRIKEIQKEMRKIGPVMRGSVVTIGTPNKRFCFSLTKKGKTQLIYLGKNRVKQAREYSENYKKLKELVEEMTQLNMILLKKDYQT